MADILNVPFHGLHYPHYKISTCVCNVLIIYYNRRNRNGGFFLRSIVMFRSSNFSTVSAHTSRRAIHYEGRL